MHELVKDALGFTSTSVRSSGRTPVTNQPQRSRAARFQLWHWILLTLIVLLICFSLLAVHWPFTEAKVIADLEDALEGKVEFGKFHQTYFPPGCVAEDIVIKNYGGLRDPVPITARKLTIQSSFRGLIARRIRLLRAEGVHITGESVKYFSKWGKNSPANASKKPKSKAVIEDYLFVQSVLEFSRGTGKGTKFDISELSLRRAGPQNAFEFDTRLRNPKPAGELHLRGSLGPWLTPDSGKTPVSGNYSFQHGDLSSFHGIAGTVSSQGAFKGTLQQLQVRGTTDTPDFEVTSAGHKIGLSTQFQARVDARTGDVTLDQVAARLGRSGLQSQGKIAGANNQKGKTMALDLQVGNGGIQDFLFLFMKDRLPPLSGVFTFKGHARLPPGRGPFVKRIELEGEFGIGDATLSNPATQNKLENLSERAEGEKDAPPETIVSELKGHGVLRGGIATFDDLTFRVPGAKARVHGTYSLITHRVDLHGRLATETTLPKATSGIKSFFLKVISPLLKKNHRGGGIVALSVTGLYPHPVYKTAPIAHPI